MILCTLSPILIRYQGKPEGVKPNTAIGSQTKPLIFRSAMSTKPGYDSTLSNTCFNSKNKIFKGGTEQSLNELWS